jgi:hypothetical protein
MLILSNLIGVSLRKTVKNPNPLITLFTTYFFQIDQFNALKVVQHNLLKVTNEFLAFGLSQTHFSNKLEVLIFNLHVGLMTYFAMILISIFMALIDNPTVFTNSVASVSLYMIYHVVDYFIQV